MVKISGGKYMCLTLLAVVGFCLEFVLAFVLEPMIWGVSLADYSASQYIIHWTITCVVWGIVGFGLMIAAKNKYKYDILKKGSSMIWWQWIIIIGCIAASLIVSYINWNGFKALKEYNNLGLLKLANCNSKLQ